MVLLGGALLGSVGAASTYAPAAATPIALGGLRVAAGAVVLIAVIPRFGGNRQHAFGLVRRPRLWVMATCTAMFQPLYLGAVDRTGVALSALLAVGAIPVCAAAVSFLVLGHRPTHRWTAATALAVIGLTIRSWSELHAGDAVGVAMALIAAFAVGCYLVAANVELQHGAPPIEISAIAYLLAAVLLAPFVVNEPLAWAVTPSGVAVIVYLGIVTMGVGNLLPMYGMRSLRPGPAATLMLSDPLIATLLGLLLFDEQLDTPATIGIALVAAGLVLQALATDNDPHANGVPASGVPNHLTSVSNETAQ
jgi:DME family drug/metabolite transporter